MPCARLLAPSLVEALAAAAACAGGGGRAQRSAAVGAGAAIGGLRLGARPAPCSATQSAWLHVKPASGSHAYHHGGAGSDEEAEAAGEARPSEPEQLTRLRDAIERASEAAIEGQQAREAAQLPDFIARHAMRDPLGMLMSSRGVPLGISLRVNADSLRNRQPGGQQQQQQRNREAAVGDEQDWQELLAGARRSSAARPPWQQTAGNADEDHHTAVPSTDAQVLRQKLVKAARRLMRSEARDPHARLQQQQQQLATASSVSAEQPGLLQQQQQVRQDGDGSGRGVGQQAREQLAALLASADAGGDAWGTTRQSAAEIAQHIADSNRAAAGRGGEGGGDGAGSDDEEPLQLSPEEARYADPAAVAADLRELDEIYEVLAKVPWLDDGDVEERELRGVVAVGLLGTLEEVGWQLRGKLLSLWAGERDADVLTEGVGEREAAALSAILWHTEKLEAQFGKPPADGVAAALAAAAAGAGAGAAASEQPEGK